MNKVQIHLKRIPNKGRTIGQLREQYEIEKELARRLRNASKEERKNLYSKLYDELFEKVPHHPQLTRKADAKAQRYVIATQMKILSDFLSAKNTFLELGAGDCQLSFEVKM